MIHAILYHHFHCLHYNPHPWKLQYYFVGHLYPIFLILLDEEHLTMKEGPSAHHILFFVGYDL